MNTCKHMNTCKDSITQEDIMIDMNTCKHIYDGSVNYEDDGSVEEKCGDRWSGCRLVHHLLAHGRELVREAPCWFLGRRSTPAW